MAQPLPDVKLSRKERELQFRMNLVLDAAEEVFSEASYAAASVEDIARRAEISVLKKDPAFVRLPVIVRCTRHLPCSKPLVVRASIAVFTKIDNVGFRECLPNWYFKVSADINAVCTMKRESIDYSG